MLKCAPLLFAFCLLLFPASSKAQTDSVTLPAPTGDFSVGTVTYGLVDAARLARFGPERDRGPRELVVQIWYPADEVTELTKAPYNPVSADYRKVTGNSYLRAPFSAEVNTAPVIIIAPGRGTERYLYTVLTEELVSHGFVVVSVDMPGIGYTVYGDGLVIRPSPKFRPPPGMMGGPYERVDSFFRAPTEMGVRDLEHVLDYLHQLDKQDPGNRFTGRFDLERIGLFGHSLGGRIAGALAAKDERVKAYAAMEGVPPRPVRYGGKIAFPSLLLCSTGTWPYAKDNYGSMIDNRSATVYMVLLPGFGHNSLTDNPLIYPDSYRSEIDSAEGLRIGRELLLTYFSASLTTKKDPAEALKGIRKVELTVHN